MKTRRANIDELNQVIKENIPMGYSFDQLDPEKEVPSEILADKEEYTKNNWSNTTLYITIEKMPRGKTYRMTFD